MDYRAEGIYDRLFREGRIEDGEYAILIAEAMRDDELFRALCQGGVRTTIENDRLGQERIYLRALIEISSHCRSNCLYCGLRRDNRAAVRYRLSEEEILEACHKAYSLGLRTFVLQGGEDAAWSDARLVPLIRQIHIAFPEAAITLSLGERSKASYQALHEAGASRYLLRHEVADRELYEALHPAPASYDGRVKAIEHLMQIGYQTGVGMMVGVPGQSIDHLAADLRFIAHIRPQMIGIGPFIPCSNTPFEGKAAGGTRLTLIAIAIARMCAPHALIPATTALATLLEDGELRGILAGANVLMPNFSPQRVKGNYAIYDKKSLWSIDSQEDIDRLAARLATIGFKIDFSRGDYTE